MASPPTNLVLIFPEHRCGFCYLELESIPAGIYNIIPSTFLPKQEGPFFLDFNSVIPIKTTQLQWWRNQSSCWILNLPNINPSNEDAHLWDTEQSEQDEISQNVPVESGAEIRVFGENGV